MTRRPNCPNCGKPSIITDDRFGGKYECPDCDMWAWGGKPLRSRAENNARKKDAKTRKRQVVDLVWNEDTPAWATTLGCDYPATMPEVMRAFRRKALRAHPDRGGTVEEMAALVDARNAAKAEIEGLFTGTTAVIEAPDLS